MKLSPYGTAITLILLLTVSIAAPTDDKGGKGGNYDKESHGGKGQGEGPHTISFPASKPSDAKTVPPDFVGFGYASAFLDSYDNVFSHNLINSVADRMSAPPIVRIGGTEGDHLTVDPGQRAIKKRRNGHGKCVSDSAYILGLSYFEGFKGFGNARVTFQAPLGPCGLNKTNIKEYVTRAYNAVGADKVAAIAIGNEVAKKNYEKTAGEYVKAVKRVEQIITEALDLNEQQRIFEVLDLADHQVGARSPLWTLKDAFEQGLDDNGRVKIAAEHWYQVSGQGSNTQKDLLNHTAIVSKFGPYKSAITFLSKHPQVDFVLSETGSTLGSRYPFAEHFATTLWSVDFQLYAMSQGVKRVAGTQRPEARHSLWLPGSNGEQGDSKPQVQAAFYAQPFVADFIGKGGKTDVVNMELKSDITSAYAAYGADGKLARVALVNLREWNRDADGKKDEAKIKGKGKGREKGSNQRGHRTFLIEVPAGTNSVKVGRLSAKAGAKAGGIDNGGEVITWQGQQWSFKLNNGKPHPASPETQTVTVKAGKAMVKVEDGEAVIVYI